MQRGLPVLCTGFCCYCSQSAVLCCYGRLLLCKCDVHCSKENLFCFSARAPVAVRCSHTMLACIHLSRPRAAVLSTMLLGAGSGWLRGRSA
jgi:hypothetical protein